MSRPSDVGSRPSDYDDGSGAPEREVTNPDLGIRGWLRWFWRQLTSMKVALILLLLLAVAAIPGSLVPQRAADPNGVIQFKQDHPTLFKVLDTFPIQAFDVYSSAWFSAIYLLLFISLIGCVLPRMVHHWNAWRGTPPKTPARLNRMAGFSEVRVTNADASDEERRAFAEEAVQAAAMILRRGRYRVDVQEATHRGASEVSVSAERGYLRETGNLIFHGALVGVLVCIGLGSAFMFNGQRVLHEGESFVNQLIDYDTANSGRAFVPESLTPFSARLDDLEVIYVPFEDENRNAVGQVKEFIASMTLIDPDGTEHQEEIRVNHPLRVHGSPLYLLSNGYAPKIVIKNAEGVVVFDEAVPFIPQGDVNLTSLGVVKVMHGLTGENGEDTQVGLRGFFYPSQTELETGAYTSYYPDLRNPMLTLDVYVGDLLVDGGIPQSVYTLETDEMTQLTGRAVDVDSLELRPGDTVDLPNGLGTVTLEDVPRFASFDVMQNPFQIGVLVFALTSLGGLLWSLFVPRRRMWVKAIPTDDGVTLQYAGLARGDDPALDRAVEELREQHRDAL